jgi:transposase
MLPISDRERESIVFHKRNGEKNTDIAKWLRVSVSCITRIWHRYTTLGIYTPKPQNSGRKPLVTQEQMNMVLSKIKDKPDITLSDLIDDMSLGISASALCRRLSSLGLTLKKRRYIR